MCRSRPCLLSWLHITPDDDDDGDARQVVAARVGVEVLEHRPGERLADDHDVGGPAPLDRREQLRRRRSGGRPATTTAPPPVIAMSAENCPVPCISGQATIIIGGVIAAGGRARRPRSTSAAGPVPSSGLPPRAEHVEQVVLAPHHALRHAGRAAGVEQQQVVAVAGPLGELERRARRHDVLVRRGPVRAGAGVVGDDVPALDARAAGRGCPRAARRTWRGTRRPRRRRCRTGRGSPPARSGSSC